MLNNNITAYKTVAYIRFSDEKQKGNHSIEIQKAQILMFAERNNLEIVRWCIDESTSAYSKKIESRKGMQQVIEQIQNGAEALCFYEESRLTRQITDFYFSVYSHIKEQFPHVKFYSTQTEGEWDPNNPLVQAKFVFANEESQIKSVRAKDTQSEILKEKNLSRPGSRIPTGYEIVEGNLVPNKDFRVVLLIYYLAIWGHSHQTIATYLNNANIVTKKITTWHGSTISYILNNPAYDGILQWHSNKEVFTFTNTHKSIVGPTMLHLSKQSLELKKKYGKMDTPFYFRDLLECKNCCSTLVAKDNSPRGKSKQYLVYKCASCKESVNIEIVHEAVFHELTNGISTQKEKLIKNAYEQLYSWQIKFHELKETVIHQLKAHHEKLGLLQQSNNPNKEALMNSFNESILYFKTKKDEYNSLINTIDELLNDSGFNKTLDMLLQSHIYNLSNTERRIFSLSFINKIQIDFQKDCDLTIDFRLTPFVALENFLVEKPN
ncbi:hypothetical protein DCE79_16730 [Lysinibacillus sp. 2017]|uniref:recombinase family protein n=1 Tax=unclassified Lysinibacillus TaxID=2636778 RepID=UPI000D527C9E|nr:MULTISPECIES: recombinase family protein [unclassified Lysinibacillus]AWE08889.1 hypothetical protein DCE79_16730 [Lysinibacillus sp. 2017]TGN34727.1 recombinase family protein [Lysinibacillus sp. S2017]